VVTKVGQKVDFRHHIWFDCIDDLGSSDLKI